MNTSNEDNGEPCLYCIGHRNKKQKRMKTRLCFGWKPLENSDLVINIGCNIALFVYL